jgi:hypothetical protein
LSDEFLMSDELDRMAAGYQRPVARVLKEQ